MKALQLRRGYSFQGINMKLSGVDKVISTYKRISQSFDFGDLRSVQFSHQIIAMGKCSSAFYSESTGRIMLIIS